MGVRFFPGTAPPLPAALDDLVDHRIDLDELWGTTVDRLTEQMASARTPQDALVLLQGHLMHEFRHSHHLDRVVREAANVLMPWQSVDIRALAAHLALSESQLRRRTLHAVGLSPKVLQRTLRFQGFLALAQAGAPASGRRDAEGMAGLSADVGYADQAHLSRECLRLAGVTPRQLLHGDVERCTCGHDHTASYRPFLARRAATWRA